MPYPNRNEKPNRFWPTPLEPGEAAVNTERDYPLAPRKINLEFRPREPDTRPLVEYLEAQIKLLEELFADWEEGEPEGGSFNPEITNPYTGELSVLRLVREKLPAHDRDIRSGQIQTDLLILKESYRQGGFTDHYRLNLIENQEH